MNTQTLLGECLDDAHCSLLPNTKCETNFQDSERKRCVCVEGTRPVRRNAQSGLIIGCELDVGAHLTNVDKCGQTFSLSVKRVID